MTETRQKIEEQIRAFLGECAPDFSAAVSELPRTEPVWGVVDSLSLLELVEYMEKAFGFALTPLELVPDNFETIASIGDLVEAHLQKP